MKLVGVRQRLRLAIASFSPKDGTPMKPCHLLAVAALVATASACADATMSHESRTPPSTGAAFDDGVGFGSGGVVVPPPSRSGGVGFGSGGFTDTTTVEPTMDTAGADQCTERGGVGFGSGGRVETCP